MKNYIYNDFEQIAVGNIPLIDVRAPIEFEKGAFLGSRNIPIMNDEERHLVGICYKEEGAEQATKLGYKLVSGDIKDKRVSAWHDYIKTHPNAMVYCFRGGQRSQITQQWIKDELGLEILRLDGGYKSFRNYLMDQLNPANQKAKPILLGGCTGSGKTILLKQLKNSIDLEGIANHRGSSFGSKITPQPTAINFENNLAYALITHRHQGYRYMILEDEGRNIGTRFLPKPIAQYFNKGDLVLLKVPLEERIEITMNEYVYHSQEDYNKIYINEDGLARWADYIRTSIIKIRKRCGLENCNRIMNVFEESYKHQLESGDLTGHRNWVDILLREYYDPMYQYQIQKTSHEIIFEGNTDEVLQFLKSKEI